jgi:hypothetical protein
VNDVVEQALADLIAIVRALRCHRAVQAHRLRAILDFHTLPS